MNVSEIFGILQIPETKEEGEIRAAYYRLLTGVNPEDDPEGFKRLRRAYEEGIAYVRGLDKKSRRKRLLAWSGFKIRRREDFCSSWRIFMKTYPEGRIWINGKIFCQMSFFSLWRTGKLQNGFCFPIWRSIFIFHGIYGNFWTSCFNHWI